MDPARDVSMRAATENDIPFMVSSFFHIQRAIPPHLRESRIPGVTRLISLWLDKSWILRRGDLNLGFIVLDPGMSNEPPRRVPLAMPASPDGMVLFKRLGLVIEMRRQPWLNRLGVVDTP